MARSGSHCALRKQALFRQLHYSPHAGQAEVHRSNAKRRVLACGVRWGKTTAAAMEGVAALLEPREESIGWIVAPTFDLAERTYRRIEGTFTDHFKHRIVESRPRERLLIVRNLGGGISTLRAKSADNAGSLLGEGLDWVILDEAARLRDDVWPSYISQRLVDKRGWALILSTPAGPNWFFRLIRQAKGDLDYAVWQQPSSTNPAIDPDLIKEERRRLPDEVFRQEYLAEFLGAELEPCERCGCPDPDVPGLVIVRAGQVLDVCPTCGEHVDEDGRTLLTRGPEGKPALTQIVIEPMDGIVEPPLMEAET